MKNTLVLAVFVTVGVALNSAAPGVYFTHLPSQPADTKVFRDTLGNQETSYAYSDGHSSAVALSRKDTNAHLVYPPAPVVYETPVYHHQQYHPQPAIVQAAPVIYQQDVDYHHHHHDYYA